MMSILAIGVGWAENVTVTINYNDTFDPTLPTSSSSVHSNPTAVTVNGLSLMESGIYKGTSNNSNFIMFVQNAGYIYNTENLGTIKSVAVSYSSGTSTTGKTGVYFGNSQQSTYTTTGNATIAGQSKTDTWTNSNSGYGYFQLSTSNKNVQITKIVITYDANDMPSVDSPVITGTTPFEGSTQVSISCGTTGASIYYTTDGNAPTTSSTPYSAPFTITETTTVKAIAVLGNDVSGIVEKVFTKKTIVNVSSIADFNALQDGAEFKYTGTDLVALGQSGKNLFAQDANNGVLMFDNSESFNGQMYKLGDNIPAGFYGTKTTYNGTVEMTNLTGLEASESNVVPTPIEITISEVANNFGRYAVLRGVKVNTSSKTLSAGEESVAYYIYNSIFNGTLTDGSTYDITGICFKYNNKIQFLPIEAQELPDYTLIIKRFGNTGVPFWQSVNFTKVNDKMYVCRELYPGDDGVPFTEAGIEFKIMDKNGNRLGGQDGNSPYEVHKGWFRDLPLEADKEQNFKMRDAGNYNFIIKIDDNGIAKLFVPQVSDLYLKGSFDSWGEGADFTRNEDGSYILSEIEIESASQFKIYDANGAWYPGNPSNITDDVTYVTLREDDNSNMNIPAGKWTFNIDIAKTTMVVSRILTTYRITIDPDIENGTVTADKATAAVGETVSLTIKPNAGYVVGKVNVFITETEEPIDVTDDYKFIMPDADVTVTSDFDEFEIPEGDYKKVTSAEELETGIYLIVYEDGSLAFNGGLETLDAVGNSIEVEIKGDMIESTKTVDEATFTYDAAVKTLKSASGYYIGRTAGTNGFNASETDQYTNTITIEDGHAVITSSGGPTLQYFLSGANSRFRYYASSQKAIQLYKKTNETAPTLPDPQFDGMNPFVGTTVVTIIGGTEFGDIHYTLDGSEPTLESPLYEDVITLDKTTTVKAVVYKHIGEGVYERSAVASMEFVKALEVENLTAFYTYENTDDAFGFTGNLVAIAQTGNYLYAQDDAKGVLIFGETGRTYIKGSKIPANFIAKKGAYHGAPQMQNPKYMMPSTEIATIEPVELTVAQASQENQEYLHRYAIINGATVTDNLITVGENSVKLYNRFGLEFSPEEGKVYNVIGVVGWDNDPEFFPLEYQEVKVPVELAGVSFGEGHNWATWIDNENYVLPVGVKAYVVTEVKNDVALVEELEDYIPAGVGVLLYSDNAMESVTADVYEGDVDDAESELKGMFEAGEVENAYLLYNNQFILAQDGTTLAAHRCYLPIPEEEVDGAPHILRIAVGGTVTSIDDLRYDSNGKTVRYYDLTGRYVGTSLNGKRGIFITSDGKKVVR